MCSSHLRSPSKSDIEHKNAKSEMSITIAVSLLAASSECRYLLTVPSARRLEPLKTVFVRKSQHRHAWRTPSVGAS